MLKPNPSYQPHRHLEPFGEPRTMAVLWDLSSIALALQSAKGTVLAETKDVEPVESNQTTDQESEISWDKFPQPATFPSGWDLSELV
jgi:hypothetical protein